MITRKRPLSPSPPIDHQPSKRAKLLSNLWQSQESSGSSLESQNSQQSTYTIRAIIGERIGEYLIDWANNRITGEVYAPDWVSL